MSKRCTSSGDKMASNEVGKGYNREALSTWKHIPGTHLSGGFEKMTFKLRSEYKKELSSLFL